MTKNFADLGQRCPLAQHPGGERVSKLMRTLCRCNNAGALKSMFHNRPNRTLAQKATDGSSSTQEHATACAGRPTAPQVSGDGLSNIGRQR
jgi:hypothetical protein